jgi:hypothetical protein
MTQQLREMTSFKTWDFSGPFLKNQNLAQLCSQQEQELGSLYKIRTPENTALVLKEPECLCPHAPGICWESANNPTLWGRTGRVEHKTELQVGVELNSHYQCTLRITG